MFEVGKKYKVRNWSTIAVYMGKNPLSTARRSHVFCLGNGSIVERNAEGEEFNDKEYGLDILPEEYREPMEYEGTAYVRDPQGETGCHHIGVPSDFAGKDVEFTLKEIL